MFKRLIIVIILSVTIAFLFFTLKQFSRISVSASVRADRPTQYAAHAGGMINGYTVTNCLEALNESVRLGYSLIEVDIIKTSDDKYVLSHDWEYMSNRVPFALNEPVTGDVFENYKIFNKFTPVTLNLLIEFLDKHPGISVITDTKDRDYSSLIHIAKNYPSYINRFIPQVYLFEDYEDIKKLGYNRIIVTVYDMPASVKSSPGRIAQMAEKLGAYAVTIPDELIVDKEYIKGLHFEKIDYLVHTVNSVERARELFDMGVIGVYTDFLGPGLEASEIIDHKDTNTLFYADKIAKINNILVNLSDTEKNKLNECLIYCVNSEISINRGYAELIYDDTLLSCYSSKNSKNVWLPFRKTADFLGMENYEYFAGNNERGYLFNFDGGVYKLTADRYAYMKSRGDITETLPLSEKMVTYANAFFINDAFYTEVFGCNIIKTGDYIVLTYNEDLSAEDIAKVIELISGVMKKE